jgi:hypothetical protein
MLLPLIVEHERERPAKIDLQFRPYVPRTFGKNKGEIVTVRFPKKTGLLN